MKAIVNGRIVLPTRTLTGKALLFDDKFRAIVSPEEIGDAQVIDAGGKYVVPGLIDMHIHGYLGNDSSDGEVSELVAMAEGLAKNGVTGWLPTTMTISYDALRKAFAAIREAMKPGVNPKGATILGVNSEGPFICVAKKGAQNEAYVKPLDVEFLEEYADIVRVFTVAPEEKGNMEAIRRIAAETNMLISIGHSDATYEQAVDSIEAGVRHATHLFNAMTALTHRKPGVVGAVLNDARVSTELICDTYHVNPALYEMVHALKGDKLVMITDCLRAGGLEDGEYDLGGQTVVLKDNLCRLLDGTIAGSVLTLNKGVYNVLRNTTLPVHECVKMASLNPASALGFDKTKGSIEVGKDADFFLADETFDTFGTFIGGEQVC
ncbi:MAG: N-acetylglucosamine-6-phosphate deacetylase [Eubacteriales bacterium]|nr:N-acetylglucosamine-6-phosphate deacetylase [bacterium]MDY2791977.1 N-acetylglucosamine-6-phosphate deacetylase [Eubacteriales bacterium]